MCPVADVGAAKWPADLYLARERYLAVMCGKARFADPSPNPWMWASAASCGLDSGPTGLRRLALWSLFIPPTACFASNKLVFPFEMRCHLSPNGSPPSVKAVGTPLPPKCPACQYQEGLLRTRRERGSLSAHICLAFCVFSGTRPQASTCFRA